MIALFFFFNDTATTEIYTLSLHDALPIFHDGPEPEAGHGGENQIPAAQERRREDGLGLEVGPERQCEPDDEVRDVREEGVAQDRKSTRLNSSHANISYAVFCLKKKKENIK